MTDANKGNESTTFVASGDKQPAGAAEDTTVVLEHEGRKYTRTDLLKKIDNADGFIETLKGERLKDRELLEKAAAALEKATSTKEVLEATKTVTTSGAEPSAPATIDVRAIAQETANIIRSENAAAASKVEQDANFKAAQEALTKHYGKEADAKVKEIAAANDLSFEDALVMARSKPKVFAGLFLPKTAAAAPTFRSTHQTGAAPAPASTGKGYWKADKTRDRVSSYLDKLNAASAG